MPSENKFGMLRKLLRALGLSPEAADDVVNFIVDLLAGESKDASKTAQSPEFPYHLRDHFLSPAELSFFNVLRTAIGNRAALCTKVALGDIFMVKKDDPSRYRIYTNKIDRKHVDFLLCDPITMRPVLGIELDDKSHQRQDRQERDAFVDQVFAAARLPLLHVPVKRGYVVSELSAQLAPFLGSGLEPQIPAPPPTTIPTPPSTTVKPVQTPPVSSQKKLPVCPKCGGEMVLRKVRSGANAGNRFWGCSNYPTCHTILPYEETS